MIGPLSLEGVIAPKGSTKYPLDLHWRKEPPFWRGSIENAYCKTYPKFQGQVLCYQCGAIPCPYKHDEDSEKKQRLADMEFVKELAKDRREMKEEIKEIETRVSELKVVEATLTEENIVLASKVDYFERLQEEWNRSKMLMEAEIRRLNSLNENNKELIQAMKKDAYRIQMLTQKCEALEDENARLTDELTNYKRIMNDQNSEIETLNSSNRDMVKKFEKSHSKVKKLVVQVEESQLELDKAKKQLKEKDNTIHKIEQELRDIIEELAIKTREFQFKKMESEQLIQELKNYIGDLQRQVGEGKDENENLKRRIKQLENEIEMLKKKLASDTRFRQFVDIKREYNVLRDASGTLAIKVQAYENEIPLPVVKKSGKLSKNKSNVAGPGTRPRNSILNRAQSARIPVRPPTANSSVGDIADFDDYDDASRPQSSASPFRSAQPSRSQSAMSCRGNTPDDSGLESAGLSTRLTSLLGGRNSRPKSSFMRSSSAMSNHTARTVRILESPIDITMNTNIQTSSSLQPVQNYSLKPTDEKTGFADNPVATSSAQTESGFESKSADDIYVKDGSVARPSTPVDTGKETSEAKQEEDEEEGNFSDYSFTDFELNEEVF